MRKLVIANQWCAYLWVDIANHAVDVYDEVVLLTGHISELNTPLSEAVSVHSLPKYSRQSLLSRWASWVGGFVSLAWALRTKYKDYEVLLSTNPPLATWLPLFVRNKCALYIMDLYPEALILTGMVGPRNPVYRIWRRLNRAAYPRFNQVFVITEGMKTALKELEVPRTQVIPLWSANVRGSIGIDSSENAFVKRYGLENKFLVVYSGNLGKEHDISGLIGAAERLQSRDEVKFLIIGQGWNFDAAKSEVTARGLENILLLPFQDSETFQLVMAAASLGVVAQSGGTASVCIPSKTFNLLAYGLPVLAIASKDSELAAIIKYHSCGKTFTSEESEFMADFISSLSTDTTLAKEYRCAAGAAAEHYSIENARRLIEDMYAANA